MVYVFTGMENVIFWSDDKKTLCNKWVAWIGKKSWRFYQRRIDHNSHYDRNILRTKGGKRKTTKDVSGCHGYHETCRWNSWWGVGERLYSLQKMDQWVVSQQFYSPTKDDKITQHHRSIGKRPWAQANSPCPWGDAFMSFLVGISHYLSRPTLCIIRGW